MFAIRNKKLLGAPGIATRSKDATRGSWPYYEEQCLLFGIRSYYGPLASLLGARTLLGAPGLTTRSKEQEATRGSRHRY